MASPIAPKGFNTYDLLSGWGAMHPNVYGPVGPGNAAWIANLAVYMPFTLPFDFTGTGLVYSNGANTGNICLGIYNDSGTRLVTTGSFAANSAVVTDPHATAFSISAGRYYLGFSRDNVGGTIQWDFSSTGIKKAVWRMCGILEETSAFPLPATMNPTAAANYKIPVIGAYSVTPLY